MKKIVKSILLLFILINMGLTANMMVTYAFGDPCAVNPYIPACFIQSAGKNTGIPDFATKFYTANQHVETPDNPDFEGIKPLTSPLYYALDIFRFAVSAIAIIAIIIAAIKLIVAEGTDEELTKAKDTLIYAIIGLMLIQLASAIVKKMFFGEYGEAFATDDHGDNPSQNFAFTTASEIRGVIGLIEYFIGAVAFLVLVIRGYAIMFGGGNEENMTKAKRHVAYAAIGIVIVGLSEVIVRGFIFPNDGAVLPDQATGRALLLQVINFISGFIAIASFLMLFYAGYRYVTAGFEGQEVEKIKKILIGVAIGLVLTLGSFAIANTVLSLDAPAADTETGDQPTMMD